MSGHRRREYVLLDMLRKLQPLSRRQRLELIIRLSIPSMLAQLSVIIMMYIDASMVGSLGANASAAIGLVSTTTWLFSGLCSAAGTGFSVQVAHRIGANDLRGARSVLRQSFVAVLSFGVLLAGVGYAISGMLPEWLGGGEDIVSESSRYFSIFALSLPFMQLNHLSGSMLRSSGNMRVPSVLSILMCVLDVLFNMLLIFPTREVSVLGVVVGVPGAGLGVSGAALGTALAELVTAGMMTTYLCSRSRELRLVKERGSFCPTRRSLREAVRIGLPIGIEHGVMCGAQIMTTVIVAPLGAAAIAANSFAITAESLCYMPGYGIGDAATTLVGQSKGSGSREMMNGFARMTVGVGMLVMLLMGVVMYVLAPWMIGVMTPDAEIRMLGVGALRIEAYAEAMYAASIVAYGAFVGAGDTLIPSIMNLGSIWAVRLPLALIFAPRYGLVGVWIAMSIELCFRGVIFLLRLYFGKWQRAGVRRGS